jgi:stearoyl-CoA desaturase (delta-9 desaturase)
MAEKTQGKKRPLSTPIRVIGQWLDSDFRREDAPNTESLPDKINWERTLPFIFLHLGCLAVFLVGFSWVSAGAAIFLYLLRMFAITGFYHRYFSHRSFKTSRVVQFFFALLGNSSMQRGPLWWAATHRHHHKHSDEKNDAHSPVHHGFAWSHIGWLTSMKNFPTNYKAIPDLKKYPELVFLNRFDQIVPFIYGLIMISTGFILEILAPSLNVTMWQFFIWTFFISTTVLLHGTLFINSLAHVWGKRRYETKDDSRNSFLLSVITLGEGWHNNHHRYPHSARQGFHAAEIDFTYYGLKTLSWMGLIWDLKPVPSKIKEEGQTLS